MDSHEVSQSPKCFSEGPLAWVVKHAVVCQNQDMESDVIPSFVVSEDPESSDESSRDTSKKSNQLV